jgi:hypothetical protein
MNDIERSNSAELAPAAPSGRLRLWLIILTVVVALAFVAAIPAAFFATFMGAFAADDANAPADSAWNLMVTLWGFEAGFYVLLVAGVVGGWIAYRKRRNRLSFGLSLLAAAPIMLVLVAVVAVVLMNVIWTMTL